MFNIGLRFRERACGALLLGALSGCARSAVPSLDPESLTAPELRGLSPRTVDVRVIDERPVSNEDRRATERHLADVLGRVLATRGVTVESAAAHRWFITVQQPVSRSDQLDPATCVEIQSEIAIWGISSPASSITRCSSWRQGGTAFGSGVLGFNGAMDQVLRRLDEQLGIVLSRFAPPTFVAARIESPRFAWLQPREMDLEISDQVSSDGASGKSLEQALEGAFARSGIRRARAAGYRLAWVMRRPVQPQGGPAAACVELRVEARHGQDIFRSAFETCSGSGDRLVSAILRELDAQGDARLRAPLRRRAAPARPLRTDVAVDRTRLARRACSPGSSLDGQALARSLAARAGSKQQ
jgi:hypothetical protein